MSVEREIQHASDVFYEALNRVVKSDGSLMPDAWWHDDVVSTTHPMGGWAVGWDEVAATWDELAKTLSLGSVEVTDLEICTLGDVAYTVGVEHIQFTVVGKAVSFKANTTNIYQRRDGKWKIVHHHPDNAPAVEDAIASG